MKLNKRLLVGIFAVLLFLLLATPVGIYVHAVFESVRNYKAMSYDTVMQHFIGHQGEFDMIRAMILDDIKRLGIPKMFLSTHVESMNQRDINKHRQIEYSEILNRLPPCSVYGTSNSVVFVLARIGFAGNTKGKGLAWYKDKNPVQGMTRDNTSLGKDGWYYLHYR